MQGRGRWGRNSAEGVCDPLARPGVTLVPELSALSGHGSCLPLQTVSFLRAVAVPSTLVLDRSPWGGSRVASRDPTKWG